MDPALALAAMSSCSVGDEGSDPIDVAESDDLCGERERAAPGSSRTFVTPSNLVRGDGFVGDFLGRAWSRMTANKGTVDMINTISKCLGLCALALALSCSVADDSTHRIDVAETNDLGLATLQTERVQDHGNTVFMLRGFSADDQELASVRLTTGVIPDLPQLLPGDDLGSEFVVAVAGSASSRIVTRETQRFLFQPTAGTSVARFLALDAVSAALEREANFFVVKPAADSAEDLYMAQSCPANTLLTTPVAKQCCYTDGVSDPYSGPGVLQTMFVRGSDSKVIIRYRNPYGTACKAADGISPCSGAACFYGPFGFSRAEVDSWGANPVIKKFSANSGYPDYILSTWCGSGTGAPSYGDKTGTNPPGQSCPGADPGPGVWDY